MQGTVRTATEGSRLNGSRFARIPIPTGFPRRRRPACHTLAIHTARLVEASQDLAEPPRTSVDSARMVARSPEVCRARLASAERSDVSAGGSAWPASRPVFEAWCRRRSAANAILLADIVSTGFLPERLVAREHDSLHASPAAGPCSSVRVVPRSVVRRHRGASDRLVRTRAPFWLTRCARRTPEIRAREGTTLVATATRAHSGEQ